MFQEEFKDHLSKFNTSPYLFIGSGFSRRYLETDAWQDLLRNMTIELNLPKPYDYYKSNANSDLPKVASLMGEDFNEIWWSNEEFKESRKAFSQNTTSIHSPLKYEISKYLCSKNEIVENEVFSKELRLLKKVNIDGIITTNWDILTEKLFPTYPTFIGQEELIFSELINVGEIYKIHGCVTKPNSLILTKEDYNEFNNRNAYLAAKLLTQFIENPIIFIGYSLGDNNIQEILKSIIKCLTKDNIEKLKDRLIFCQWSESVADTKITDSVINVSETTIPIKLVELNHFIDLFTVLADNKRKFPIKVLRQMKGMIYDFVKSNKSTENIYVTDSLDNIEDIHKAEFVYGVGIKDKLAEKGITGLGLKDVLNDIINDNGWNPEDIAQVLLPRLQTRAKFIPYFKYLNKGGFLTQDNLIDENSEVIDFNPEFIETVNAIKKEDFYPPESYKRKKPEINENCNAIQDIVNNYSNVLHHLIYIPLLDTDKISIPELKIFLEENQKLLNDSKYGTHFRKLICLYDYLKFKGV